VAAGRPPPAYVAGSASRRRWSNASKLGLRPPAAPALPWPAAAAPPPRPPPADGERRGTGDGKGDAREGLRPARRSARSASSSERSDAIGDSGARPLLLRPPGDAGAAPPPREGDAMGDGMPLRSSLRSWRRLSRAPPVLLLRGRAFSAPPAQARAAPSAAAALEAGE